MVIAGLPLLHWLQFDFNPINLRDPNTEAVATYLELARDPATDVNAIQVLAPSLDGSRRPRDKTGAAAGSLACPDAVDLHPATAGRKAAAHRQGAGETLDAAFDPRTSRRRRPTPKMSMPSTRRAQRLNEAADDPHNSGQKARHRRGEKAGGGAVPPSQRPMPAARARRRKH